MIRKSTNKERFLNGALSLYSRYGIKSITMDSLCRELGISKKTIYQYVEDKQQLIEEVIEHEKLLHNEIMDKMIQSDLNAIDELIHANRQIHLSQSIHSHTFYFDLKKYYPNVYEPWVEYKRERMYSMILRNLNKGIDEGFYREDLNVDVISRLHMARAEMLYSSDIMSDDEVSNARFIDEVFKYHIHGICNERGIKYFNSKINDVEK